MGKIPDVILNDADLNEAVKKLPSNYNLEVHKTVWRIRETNAKRVALQMPEGLLLYACDLADIIEDFTDADTVIMGDVTYGACCIDDFSARALGCDMLVHYGHSCLVPIQATHDITVLYIFVNIDIPVEGVARSLRENFAKDSSVALISTIQFATALQKLLPLLSDHCSVIVPQSKPLSPGEVLGCTAPTLKTPVDAIVYVGDGRFHLEAMMIANPRIPAYKYDPYSSVLSREDYDYDKMMAIRKTAVQKAAAAEKFGLILGTLGRQGNVNIMKNVENQLKDASKDFVVLLLSEIFPEKLQLMPEVDSWIQIACPRLSIDWGLAFEKPVLTPYELSAALKSVAWQEQYPMDYYAFDSLGPWTNNNEKHRPRPTRRTRVAVSVDK